MEYLGVVFLKFDFYTIKLIFSVFFLKLVMPTLLLSWLLSHCHLINLYFRHQGRISV